MAPTVTPPTSCYSFPQLPYATLYNASVVPMSEQTDSGNQVVVGVQLNFSVPGAITAIRYYRAQNEGKSNHWGKIWDSNQNLMTKVLFNETYCAPEAWTRQVLPTPLNVSANTVYMVGIDYLIWYATIDGGTSNRLTNGNVGTPGEHS